MTRFVVVRHGETRWNLEGRIQGHADSELTAAGIEQARTIGRRLATEPFDLMVSSDLGRALHTARCIAEHARCGVLRRDARLRERNFGVGEGLTYEELDRRWPDAFTRARDTDPDYAVPGGESRNAFHGRVVGAFEALAQERPGGRILVVAHGGVLSALYRHIRGIGVSTAHRISIPNASYNAVTLHDARWSIEAWADISHLPEGVDFEDT